MEENKPNDSKGCYLTLRITENGLESCIDSYDYTWGCKETPTSKVVSYCSFMDIESMNDYFLSKPKPLTFLLGRKLK